MKDENVDKEVKDKAAEGNEEVNNKAENDGNVEMKNEETQ